MECKGCASHNIKNFNGELAIHFSGLDGLTKPIVWVFPSLDVCLVCGSSSFNIPEEQLNLLRGGGPPHTEARDVVLN